MEIFKISPKYVKIDRLFKLSCRDDPAECDTMPDFWLILEITQETPQTLEGKIDPPLDIPEPGKIMVGIPEKVPVIRLYHHRRSADEPHTFMVEGDPINFQYDIERKENDDLNMKLDPKVLTRERNLTDADNSFIEQIREYIRYLVKRVNQQYLLLRLSELRLCYEILVENNSQGKVFYLKTKRSSRINLIH